MTTDKLLELLEARGLKVIAHEGQPAIRGKPSAVTPALLKVLAWHREELSRRLGIVAKPRMREYLWRGGHTYTTDEHDFHCLQGGSPAGAWWWRFVGDKGWMPIPGVNPENHPRPEVE